jgi:hypothetical protein
MRGPPGSCGSAPGVARVARVVRVVRVSPPGLRDSPPVVSVVDPRPPPGGSTVAPCHGWVGSSTTHGVAARVGAIRRVRDGRFVASCHGTTAARPRDPPGERTVSPLGTPFARRAIGRAPGGHEAMDATRGERPVAARDRRYVSRVRGTDRVARRFSRAVAARLRRHAAGSSSTFHRSASMDRWAEQPRSRRTQHPPSGPGCRTGPVTANACGSAARPDRPGRARRPATASQLEAISPWIACRCGIATRVRRRRSNR